MIWTIISFHTLTLSWEKNTTDPTHGLHDGFVWNDLELTSSDLSNKHFLHAWCVPGSPSNRGAQSCKDLPISVLSEFTFKGGSLSQRKQISNSDANGLWPVPGSKEEAVYWRQSTGYPSSSHSSSFFESHRSPKFVAGHVAMRASLVAQMVKNLPAIRET